MVPDAYILDKSWQSSASNNERFERSVIRKAEAIGGRHRSTQDLRLCVLKRLKSFDLATRLPG